MKTKLFHLIITLVSAILITGCQEEEMPWEKAQRDVNGTEWSAIGDDTVYSMKFENGIYTIKYTNTSGSGTIRGNYTQNGTKIQFEKKIMVTWGFFFIETGEIQTNRMKVPLYNDNYWSDKEYRETLDFILLI
jgi:hypothetical protein